MEGKKEKGVEEVKGSGWDQRRGGVQRRGGGQTRGGGLRRGGGGNEEVEEIKKM
jgi:hypothetical protein